MAMVGIRRLAMPMQARHISTWDLDPISIFVDGLVYIQIAALQRDALARSSHSLTLHFWPQPVTGAGPPQILIKFSLFTSIIRLIQKIPILILNFMFSPRQI